jgi:hypothetical protein
MRIRDRLYTVVLTATKFSPDHSVHDGSHHEKELTSAACISRERRTAERVSDAREGVIEVEAGGCVAVAAANEWALPV